MSDVAAAQLDVAQDAIIAPSVTIPNCTTVNGSASVTAVSFAASVQVGDTITGAGIPASTTVREVGATILFMSNTATAGGTVPLTFGTVYFLSLHTGDPGQTGANEGTDGRQAITFLPSLNGTQNSSSTQTWSSAVGGQTYGWFGLWTLTSGGSFQRGGALTSNITPPAGSQIQFLSGAITLTAS